MKVELEVSLPGERLTDDEYNLIYGGDGQKGKAPRFCIDTLLVSNNKIMLARRIIEPFKGYWNLAGGALMFAESIEQALCRTLQGELGVELVASQEIGVIEHYPDGLCKHSISVAYVVKIRGEVCPKDQASELRFFSEIPDHTQPYHATFLKKNWQKIIDTASSL